MSSSKYKAKRTVYNGISYDSGLEASVAQTLDSLMTQDQQDNRDFVEFIDEQVPFTLIPKSKWGKAIVYKADFVVIFTNPKTKGTRRIIIETKGFENPVWKLKERMFREKYPSTDLRVVKDPGEVISIAEEPHKNV